MTGMTMITMIIITTITIIIATEAIPDTVVTPTVVALIARDTAVTRDTAVKMTIEILMGWRSNDLLSFALMVSARKTSYDLSGFIPDLHRVNR